MNAPEAKDFRTMTADSIGRDILSALVTEIKLMPEPWPKLSKAKQDDVIDRLRLRVEHNVKMAVHLIASDGRTVVAGDLDQITIKDGVKVIVKFGASVANLHELYDQSGKAVLIVVANSADHTGGMDEVTGESDQRAMNLGKEYKPDGDGEGMPGTGDIVEGEVLGLPAPDDIDPTEAELENAFNDGYAAAKADKLKVDCPKMSAPLVIEWINGFEVWHEQQSRLARGKKGGKK